ncbi:MAG: hypothetical protein HKN19_10490 [Halioglobus sp.]|nr:hypothetical protein [Halioglobus sp.]
MSLEPQPVHQIPSYQPLHDTDSGRPWFTTPRAKLFAVVFTLVLVTGLVATFMQPTIYRSAATVLMTAALAIDEENTEANIQQVEIQGRILLGGEVSRQLLRTLHDTGITEVDAPYLREVLSVHAVTDTNLVEMAAQGPDRELLPELVDTWIDVYLAIRTAHVQESQGQTLQVVNDQLADLEAKLEKARTALADYRDEHNISSAERQENEELSRLDGLNKALNKAVDNEIQTQAFLETLRKAIEDGKDVIPTSERAEIAAMKRELASLESRIKNLQKTYTLDFIARNPKWRDIPIRKAELERELGAALADGRREALAQSEQAMEAAKQAVIDLQERLAAQQEKAAHFTTVYATHEALVEDLAELEALNRETQSRLVQVQVNQVEKYPQVQVIDRPGAEAERVGPDYRLWLGGTLGAALGLGVLAVWLYGFLGPREKPAFVTLSGVHMYPQDMGALPQGQAPGQLAQSQAPLLDQQAAAPDTPEPPPPLPDDGEDKP